MPHKRRKATAPANTGRSCVICRCHITPQWRRVMWKGKERDACNKCGISLRDFILRTDRDFNRDPTDNELAAWGQARANSLPVSSPLSSPAAMPSFVDPSVYDDVEAVAAAEILVEMARSSRSAHSPPSQYSSSSSTFSTFSSKAPTPFSSSAPTATISLEAVSSRPSNTGPGLVVEVEPIYEYDAYSDLGLTVSSLSPTWSTFELSTRAQVAAFELASKNITLDSSPIEFTVEFHCH